MSIENDAGVPPDFSIVIVNWNGGQLLLDCLDSILPATGGLNVETVVVDNDSKDDSVSQVQEKFPGVKVVRAGGNVGFGRGCNIGVKASTGRLLMFLNPDALLQPDTLREIRNFMTAHPETGAVGCKVKDLEGTVQELGIQRDPTPLLEFVKMLGVARWQRTENNKWFPRKDPLSSGPVTKLYGACLVVRRNVFNQIGGFDDRFFMYCEDVDICRKVLAGGHGLYYLAEAEIVHNQGSCSRKAPSGFSILMQCDSLDKYMRKYHGRMGAWMYRACVAGASSLRALPLSGMVALTAMSQGARQKWRDKWLRNWFTLRWSLSLAKAFVPN